MARYSFKLPDIGEGIAEAEIVAWHAKLGDVIAEDDPLCDMMTDKATVEMTAPVSGRIVAVAGEIGDQIAIGSVLAVFETEGEAAEVTAEMKPEEPSAPAGEERASEQSERPAEKNWDDGASSAPARAPLPQGEREQHRRVLASPAVRERARNLGIDLAQVKAEGDRIRHADLDAFLTYNQGYRSAGTARPDEQIKVVGLRRRIAENMSASKRHIPHFTYVEEFDVTKLEALRADLNEARGSKDRLTILPLRILAI